MFAVTVGMSVQCDDQLCQVKSECFVLRSYARE